MSRTGWLSQVDSVPLAAVETQVDISARDFPMRLLSLDARSDLNEAFQGAQRMVREEAQVVFVSCDREFALPSVQEAASLLTFIPCPINQSWPQPNVFSFGLTPQAEGRTLSNYIQSTGITNVALFSDTNSGYSEQVCAEFSRQFRAGGGRIFANVSISYAADQSSFTGIAAQPYLRNVEAIVICAVLPTGRSLYDAIRTQGVLAPVFAGSLMDGAWLSENRRQGSLRVLSYGSVWGDDPEPAVNALIDKMRDIYPDLALDGRAVAAGDAVAAFVYAASMVATDSDEGRSAEALTRALEQSQSVQVISGEVRFDPNMHVLSRKSLRVIESANGIPPRTVALVIGE